MWLDVSTHHEVSHRSEEDHSDRSANDSMEPLPEEDVLEAIHVHTLVLIDVEPLWALFVLFKLFLPFFSVHWRKYAVGLPSDHGQATLGEACVASNPDDGKDRGTDKGQPGSDNLFFASDNELLALHVEDNRIVRDMTVVLGATRCLG